MTEEQYNMTFFEWCNATKLTGLILDEYGNVDYKNPMRKQVTDQYHDLWVAECKEYRLRSKNQKITSALQAIKSDGIQCVLCSYQSGHIKAKSRHGVVYSYYATTGTIAGYKGTNTEGLDEFIKLCKTS